MKRAKPVAFAVFVGAVVLANWMISHVGTVQLGIPWAADNDCYQGFQVGPFLTMLGQLAGRPGGLFVASPDVVGDAVTTLERFREWEPIIHAAALPVALVAQDGLEDRAVPWQDLEALFVGGTTEWKLGEPAAWLVREAKFRGRWVHMGRVNSWRRFEYAQAIGCDSVDGTMISRWTATHTPRVKRWLASFPQGQLPFGGQE
jgi:hypothetical protein